MGPDFAIEKDRAGRDVYFVKGNMAHEVSVEGLEDFDVADTVGHLSILGPQKSSQLDSPGFYIIS